MKLTKYINIALMFGAIFMILSYVIPRIIQHNKGCIRATIEITKKHSYYSVPNATQIYELTYCIPGTLYEFKDYVPQSIYETYQVDTYYKAEICDGKIW